MQSSMSMRASRRCTVRCNASTTTTTTKAVVPKAADIKSWQALDISKAKLVDTLNGKTTRNVDGVIYDISYDSASDVVVVVDRTRGLKFPSAVGADSRVRIDLTNPEPFAVPGFSVDMLSSVLKATDKGAELCNARTAMMAFPVVFGIKLATGTPLLQQLGSPVGVAAAAALGLAVLAASVAPAVAGKVPTSKVFPDENDAYATGRMPYYFSPLAEKLNGRVAMIGMAGLLATEVFLK